MSSLPQRLARHPFLYYIALDWKKFSLGLFFVFLTNLFDAAFMPLLMKRGVDQIANQASLHELSITCGYFLATISVMAIFRFCWRIFWGQFHHSVAEDLRRRLFHKYSAMGPSFYQTRPTGQLMSLVTNDINTFRMAIGPGILVLFDAISMAAIILPVMYYFSPEWLWKTLILLPIVPFIIAKIETIYQKLFSEQQDKFSEVSGISQEIVAGIKVIKSYAQEHNRTRLFNLKSKELQQASDKSAWVDSFFNPSMEFMVAIGSMILLLIASPGVIGGAVTIGTLVMFHRYIQKMIWPMTALGMGVTLILQGKASFERIIEVLKVPEDVPDSGTEEPSDFNQLKVKNLSFTYPGENRPALKSISFEIKKGEKIGIIGSVGSGKSTLVNVLCRLYQAPQDTIFFDQTPIEKIRKNHLRDLISVVPQESFLFSQSILDNIGFGLEHPPQHDDAEKIARIAAIEKEIIAMPDRYETLLGERGLNISGGQKQRLSLARAMIRNPQLLILDDSLSAVDAETAEEITQNMKSTNINRTTITVSHRLSVIKNSDRVIVLNNGEIEAIGTEVELLAISPTYRKLHQLQGQARA